MWRWTGAVGGTETSGASPEPVAQSGLEAARGLLVPPSARLTPPQRAVFARQLIVIKCARGSIGLFRLSNTSTMTAFSAMVSENGRRGEATSMASILLGDLSALQRRAPVQVPLPEFYFQASEAETADKIAAARSILGKRVFILGHHYQRDEII